VEQAEQTPENEQETQTFSPPTLVLDPTIKNIDDFKLEHLQLQNYQSHPAIKGEVAV
jgi:thymidylate synthase